MPVPVPLAAISNGWSVRCRVVVPFGLAPSLVHECVSICMYVVITCLLQWEIVADLGWHSNQQMATNNDVRRWRRNNLTESQQTNSIERRERRGRRGEVEEGWIVTSTITPPTRNVLRYVLSFVLLR